MKTEKLKKFEGLIRPIRSLSCDALQRTLLFDFCGGRSLLIEQDCLIMRCLCDRCFEYKELCFDRSVYRCLRSWYSTWLHMLDGSTFKIRTKSIRCLHASSRFLFGWLCLIRQKASFHDSSGKSPSLLTMIPVILREKDRAD